jgi:peptidoglycan pentaglycine glycine transferase (the first glycine)
MIFRELTAQDRLEYEQYVAAHSGSFLQSWGWGEWQRTLGKNPKRFVITDPSGTWLMAGQGLLTTVPLLNKPYLYFPHGPFGEARMADEFLKGVLDRVPGIIFARIEPQQIFATSGSPTPRIQPGKTLIVDLKKSEQELLSGMHHKTRYNIKVAAKHGVTITTGHDEEALQLLHATAGRQGFRSHPLSYYGNLLSFFAQAEQATRAILYRANYKERMVAAAIMLDFASTRTYLFGGSGEENRNVMAPYILHWQAMQDAKQAGLQRYDFWGIETSAGKTAGFVRFKLGFGGNVEEYPAPTDHVVKPLWYTTYVALRKLQRSFK